MRMMNNLSQLFGGNAMQMIQQLQQNPMQFLKKSGYNIPENMNDPNAIIQYLMNSGQISQERYNQARQFASWFRK